MNNYYTEACTCIAAYKAQYPTKKKGFHLTKSDVEDLLTANGGTLDGIRGYFGLDTDGELTMHVVGTVKDANGNYNDVNIETATAKLRPCPNMCSTSNVFNT